MNNTLTWLHLSDLHLTCKTDNKDWTTESNNQDTVINSLLTAIQTLLIDKQQKPNIIFITGDLVYSGQTKEYEVAKEFCEQLLTITGLTKQQLFIVAGNHDVNRKEIKPLHIESYYKFKAKDKISEILSDSDVYPVLMRKLTGFYQFSNDFLGLNCKPKQHYIIAKAIEIKEIPIKINLLGLNSALFAGYDSDDQQKLAFGSYQIEQAFDKLDKEADLTIAFFHHPFSCFHSCEKSIQNQIKQKADLILTGHLHNPSNMSQHDSAGKVVTIGAGATYETKEFENSFNVGVLDLITGQGKVQFYKYLKNHNRWTKNTDINLDEDDEGRFPFIISSLKDKSSAIKKAIPQPEKILSSNRPRTPTSFVKTPSDLEPATITSNTPESRGVFGRTEAIEKLATALQNKPILSLYGISGIGKTKLVNEIARHQVFHGHQTVLSLAMSQKITADELYRQLASSLGCRDEHPKLERNAAKNINFEMLARFTDFAEPRVLHLYKAHELFYQNGFYNHEIKGLLIAIARYLPQLRIILESSEFPPADLLADDIYQVKKLKGLDALSVQAYFKQSSKNKTGWSLTLDEAQQLYQRLGGNRKNVGAHPFGMILLASVAKGFNESPLATVARHQESFFDKLEKNLFDDLYDQVLNDAQRLVLSLCSLYRDDIPHNHADIMNQHVGEDSAFDHLVNRFLLTANDLEERYSLHSLFADLVHQRTAYQNLRDQHQLLAKAWLSQVTGKKRNTLPNLRASSEAVFHLLEAGDYQSLAKLSTHLLGPNTLDLLKQKSFNLYENHDYKNRRYVLEILVALEPDEPRHHRFFGETIEKLEGRGNEQALAHYFTAYRLSPDFSPYLADIGRCLLARHDAKTFVELVEPKLHEQVVNDQVLSLYTKCLDQIGLHPQADLLRQQKIDAGSSDPVFYADQAKRLLQQQHYTQALELLALAERRGYMNDYLNAIKTDVLQQSGQGQQASILRLQQIEAGSPNPVFYNDEACYQQAQQNYPKALAIIDQAATRGCLNHHLLVVKASILEATGQGQQASILRRQQINAKVPFAAFYTEEAIYWRNLGDYQQALDFLDQAEVLGLANGYTLSIRKSILSQQKRAGIK